MDKKINKKDAKLIERYGGMENGDFEDIIKKMLDKKPAAPTKGKGKKKL